MLSLSLDVTDKPVLVVGAGPVGARRALTLWEAGARVHVVAPQGVTAIRMGAAVGRWTWERRAWRPGDERAFRLVVVAVPVPDVASAVAEACRSAGILCNVADRPELCDVHFPALVRRGPVQVAVSTGGLAPGLAAVLRERIDAWLDASLGRFAEHLGQARELLRSRGLPEAERMRLGVALARDRAAEDAVARGEALDPADWLSRTEASDPAEDRPAGAVHELPTDDTRPSAASQGSVAIVGAGPGRPDWLTVRAARLVAEADAVLYDALVPPALLALCRPGCERVLVGRRAGRPHLDRDEIGALCVEHARRGQRVVRLKGGDPNVLAGGAEELGAVRDAGLPCEVVPGITAGLAAAVEAGVSLTRKGVASTVLLASGHLDPTDERSAVDWSAAARLGGTLVLYMPGRHLLAITTALIEGGRAPDTPLVVVHDAGLTSCRVTPSVLGRVADAMADAAASSPAVIVIGEVAADARRS